MALFDTKGVHLIGIVKERRVHLRRAEGILLGIRRHRMALASPSDAGRMANHVVGDGLNSFVSLVT